MSEAVTAAEQVVHDPYETWHAAPTAPRPASVPHPMTPRTWKEVSTVDPIPIWAVLATAALAAGLYAWRQMHRLRRALDRERAVVLLTDAAHHRDHLAYQARIDAFRNEQAVLAAADQVLTEALAHYAAQDPKEGGSQ